MMFDAEAYAEGISAHAAGSTIEVLVDKLDATISFLRERAETMDVMSEDDQDECDTLVELADDWSSLRRELVEHEENSELSFADLNDDESEEEDD